MYSSLRQNHPLIRANSTPHPTYRLPFINSDYLYDDWDPGFSVESNLGGGTLVVGSGDIALAVNKDGSTSYPYYAAAGSPNLSNNEWTMFIDFEITGIVGSFAGIISKRDGDGESFWQLNRNGDHLTFAWYNGGFYSVELTNGWADYMTTDRRHRLVLTKDANDLFRFTLNGQIIHEQTNTTSINADVTTHELSLGVLNRASTGSNRIEGLYYQVIINIASALTASEAILLTLNPYQIFKPKIQFAFADVPDDVRHVPVKIPWTKKPPENTMIDPVHPLAIGLNSFFPLNYLYEGDIHDVRTHLPQITSTPNNRGGIRGRNVYFSRAAGSEKLDYAKVVGGLDTSGLDTWTVGAWCLPNGGDDFTHDLVSQWDYAAGLNYRHFVLTAPHSTGNQVFFSAGLDNGTTFNTGEVGPNIEDGLWHFIVGTMEIEGSGCRIRVYVDGVQVGTNSHSTARMLHGTSRDFVIGGQNDASSNTYDGSIQDVSFYRRTLSASEIRSLYLDQWQIFEPRTVFMPINEALPDVASVDGPDVKSMPARPPR